MQFMARLSQIKSSNIVYVDEAGFDNRDDYPYGYCPKEDIVEEAKGEIWYLPPYSPALNKIERWWSVLKTWMKQRINEFETLRECVDAAFKQCPNVFA